jgi:hypothetical protein
MNEKSARAKLKAIRERLESLFLLPEWLLVYMMDHLLSVFSVP